MKTLNKRSIKLTIGIVVASVLSLITVGCEQARTPTVSAAPDPQPIAGLPSPAVATQLKPAAFTVTELTVDPQRANPGEEVTATAIIVNSGDVQGTYGFGLMVDGNLVSIKQVSIRPGESVTISSPISKDTSGVHTLNVGQLQSLFEVIPVVTKPTPAQSTGLPNCCAPGTATETSPTPTPTKVTPKAGCCS